MSELKNFCLLSVCLHTLVGSGYQPKQVTINQQQRTSLLFPNRSFLCKQRRVGTMPDLPSPCLYTATPINFTSKISVYFSPSPLCCSRQSLQQALNCSGLLDCNSCLKLALGYSLLHTAHSLLPTEEWIWSTTLVYVLVSTSIFSSFNPLFFCHGIKFQYLNMV